MRWLVFGLACVLAACTVQEVSEEYYGPPRVMDKSRDTIKIWAGWQINPEPIAVEHCSKIGLSPNLVKSQDFNAGVETVYWYECV